MTGSEKAIARALGVSRGTVALAAAKLGIVPKREPQIYRKVYTQAETARIKRFLHHGARVA